MKTAVPAFVAVFNAQDPQLDRARFFHTEQISKQVDYNTHRPGGEGFGVDEEDRRDHRVEHEIHEAHAHDHGRARQPLKQRIRTKTTTTSHMHHPIRACRSAELP